VRGLGLVAVLGYLVALLAALAVIMPRAYRYARANQTKQGEVFKAIVRRKWLGLQVALWAFGIATAAFAGLFVAALLGF
jgi:hypothetical protein